MEIIINQVTSPEAIEFNFDDIKREVSQKVEQYTNLIYTDEQIAEAKHDVADLRKFVKGLSDERIKVKKRCLAPYEAFEAKVKELEAVVNEPIALIDKQVKAYEAKVKAEKAEAIIDFFAENNPFEWLKFEQIANEKWLNASTSMKSVQEAIVAIIEQIQKDISMLATLPEFGFEATEVYKTSLDITKAVSEGHRLAEMQRRKEEQARLKAEQEAQKAEEERLKAESVEAVTADVQAIDEETDVMPFEDDNFVPSFDTPVAIWRTYKIELTADQKEILEQFLKASGINFAESI